MKRKNKLSQITPIGNIIQHKFESEKRSISGWAISSNDVIGSFLFIYCEKKFSNSTEKETT